MLCRVSLQALSSSARGRDRPDLRRGDARRRAVRRTPPSAAARRSLDLVCVMEGSRLGDMGSRHAQKATSRRRTSRVGAPRAGAGYLGRSGPGAMFTGLVTVVGRIARVGMQRPDTRSRRGARRRPRLWWRAQRSGAAARRGGPNRCGRSVDPRRRFFQLPNNDTFGAVRLNVAGREPAGVEDATGPTHPGRVGREPGIGRCRARRGARSGIPGRHRGRDRRGRRLRGLPGRRQHHRVGQRFAAIAGPGAGLAGIGRGQGRLRCWHG